MYPDPYTGLNNMRIPDADDSFNAQNHLLKYSHIPGKNPWVAPYWFRKSFEIPSDYAGKHIWLTFNEINYRAELWLNGQKLARPDEMAGMERSFRFDISKLVNLNGENCIAVAIYPVDVPGEPSPPPLKPLSHPGHNMGKDGTIALNYTKMDASGWDWQPPVHDRDMGITEDVFLSATDDVEISSIYVTSDLPLPSTASADLSVSLDLVNHDDKAEKGTLLICVKKDDHECIRFEQAYELQGNETLHLAWSPENQSLLHIPNPSLWWPTDMGEQNLYTLSVKRSSQSGQQSLSNLKFGIRELGTFMIGEVRGFKINGEPVYVKGGNWVIDLTLNWTASRYDTELRMARQAGLNFLRVWGPTGAPPEAFYEAADRYGIMIQQDFLNDFWGMDKNNPGLIPPEDLFRAASRQIVRRYRNHPSLVIWCGGNEGVNQREDVLVNEILPQNDPLGQRFYLRASNQYGLIGGGPYHALTPEEYFKSNKLTGFNSEIGPSGVPEIESLLKFLTLPPKDWAKDRFPLDACWTYHDATDRTAGDQRRFTHYDNILRERYGPPDAEGIEGLHQYAAKAQVVNYDTYRSAIEALNRKLWNDVTGFALWKYNSSWPSVVWQIMDWYMQPNSGFYAVRKACEPVHIQLNRDDLSISFINQDKIDICNAHIKAELYDMSMAMIWSHEQEVELIAKTASKTAWQVPSGDGISFLRLSLLDCANNEISNNFYWLSKNNDFNALNSIPLPRLKIDTSIDKDDQRSIVYLNVRNDGNTLAFMLRARLLDAATGIEILPSYWSDNYFSLLPGEAHELQVEVDSALFPDNIKIELVPVLARTLAAEN